MDIHNILLLVISLYACLIGRSSCNVKKDSKTFKEQLRIYLIYKPSAINVQEGCKNEVNWCSGYESYCSSDRNVQKYCKKMCRLCVGDADCQDKHQQCKLIVSRSLCKWYGKYCRQSCRLCRKSECGLAPLNPTTAGEIVNGKAAKAGYYPWQVGIYIRNIFHCGGALIDERHFLSAAHCFNQQEQNYKDMTITVGDINREKKEDAEQTFSVEKVTIHSQYHYKRAENDIVIVKLSGDVKMIEKYVGTICLPTKNEERNVGSYCSISGWGKTYHIGRTVEILQYVSVPVVGQSTCKSVNTWKPVTNKNICTGYNNGMNFDSACFGDSGGPLSCVDSGGVWKLHGIVSWGHPQCNALEGYNVFTKVSQHIDWINANKS